VESRRAVEHGAGHLAERRVPRLDVVVVRLDAAVVRAQVFPQPVPQVHGVVASPVEPPRAPDEVQLVEVGPVDAIVVQVDQVRKTSRQVERHLDAGMRRQIFATKNLLKFREIFTRFSRPGFGINFQTQAENMFMSPKRDPTLVTFSSSSTWPSVNDFWMR